MELGDARPFLASRRHGAIAVVDDDGFPHVSRIVYALGADDVLRISVTDDRVKTSHLRQRPRAAVHVRGDDDWHWVTAVGRVELSPVAARADDDVADELLALYEQVAGAHDDPEDFRRAMVDERRLVLRLHLDRAHGMV